MNVNESRTDNVNSTYTRPDRPPGLLDLHCGDVAPEVRRRLAVNKRLRHLHLQDAMAGICDQARGAERRERNASAPGGLSPEDVADWLRKERAAGGDGKVP